jgi:putative membrane protein
VLILFIAALVIAIFAVIFALQNTIMVTVTFLFWQFNGSLALILLVTLAIGAVVTFLAYLPALLRNHSSMRKLRKQATALEKDLNENKQHLADALLKLQTQSASSQPPETPTMPPDQPAPTS